MTSDLQLSLVLQTHALVFKSVCNKEHKGVICNTTSLSNSFQSTHQDECFGKNNLSFLDFIHNYEWTSGIFVPCYTVYPGLWIFGGPRSLSHDFKIWPITFQGSGPSGPTLFSCAENHTLIIIIKKKLSIK